MDFKSVVYSQQKRGTKKLNDLHKDCYFLNTDKKAFFAAESAP